jgi:hypothetical protein
MVLGSIIAAGLPQLHCATTPVLEAGMPYSKSESVFEHQIDVTGTDVASTVNAGTAGRTTSKLTSSLSMNQNVLK